MYFSALGQELSHGWLAWFKVISSSTWGKPETGKWTVSLVSQSQFLTEAFSFFFLCIHACGRPNAKVNLNSSNKLFTQFKASSALSICKILNFATEPLTFAENWHSGGFCGTQCISCTHFDREKVHFWSCPDRPLLQDTSIMNVI